MSVPEIAAASSRRLIPLLLATALLAYGGGSAWQHWNARAQLPAWPELVTLAEPVANPALRADALDMLFGLSPTQAPVASAAALVLRASLVSAAGASRALLASGGGEQFYREGERLPDGSVLRGIQVDRVLLWRNGREETLAVTRPAAQHFTPAAQSAAGRAAPATSLLRPLLKTEVRP